MKLFKLLFALLLVNLASTNCMQSGDGAVSKQQVIIKELIGQVALQELRIQEKISSDDTKKPTTELHIAAELGCFEYLVVWIANNCKKIDFKTKLNSKNHAFLTVKQVASYSLNVDIVNLIEKYEAE